MKILNFIIKEIWGLRRQGPRLPKIGKIVDGLNKVQQTDLPNGISAGFVPVSSSIAGRFALRCPKFQVSAHISTLIPFLPSPQHKPYLIFCIFLFRLSFLIYSFVLLDPNSAVSTSHTLSAVGLLFLFTSYIETQGKVF